MQHRVSSYPPPITKFEGRLQRVSSKLLKRLDSRFHGNDGKRHRNSFSIACFRLTSGMDIYYFVIIHKHVRCNYQTD
ncbi:MAG: hypothetical protein AAB089_03520, partial [Nitrospirota bacterium]